MKIIVAGGSGFLGRPLISVLAARGHDVVVLSRQAGGPIGPARRMVWHPDMTTALGQPTQEWAREIHEADAIVNLAGDGIADKRWTAARKVQLRGSRTHTTRQLVAALRGAPQRSRVFIQGSAVGYYGISGDEARDESSTPGPDFLAALCVAWEGEARVAEGYGCRLVIVRTGVVLARDGGALKKMVPPFQLYAGGPMASGRQYLSWIHRDDWIAMVAWALETPAVSGVLNATAPNPVTNAEFSRALGRALGRPSWLPMPGFALRLLVGEMANAALINGQRIVPTRALSLGFAFQHAEIDEAMMSAVSSRA
jgi:hypothetical protein